MDCLGHVVSIGGVKPDLAKIKAIKEWKQLENVKKLQSFLGLAGDYRRFIQDCTKIATPLTDLTRKKTPYEWTSTQEEAFNELKTQLTEAPVLKTMDPKKDYPVTCNGSETVVGAVLSQVDDTGDHPVAFESHKMTWAKVNYPTHERELSAVIHALRTWRHYLKGRRFKVVTDHYTLKFLIMQPHLSKC